MIIDSNTFIPRRLSLEHQEARMWIDQVWIKGADHFDFSDKLTFLAELNDLMGQLK